MSVIDAKLKFDTSKVDYKVSTTYKGIVLHCSDSDIPAHDSPQVIHKWHKERGWSGCGYAFYINREGVVFACRPLSVIGSHCHGHNQFNIGICLGGRTFEDLNTEQFESLRDIVNSLCKHLKILRENVKGHCEFDDSKTCPNFSVESALK